MHYVCILITNASFSAFPLGNLTHLEIPHPPYARSHPNNGHLDTRAQPHHPRHQPPHCCPRGRVIMDKYYSRTDESIMYRMAMSKWIAAMSLTVYTHAMQCFTHNTRHPTSRTRTGSGSGSTRPRTSSWSSGKSTTRVPCRRLIRMPQSR